MRTYTVHIFKNAKTLVSAEPFGTDITAARKFAVEYNRSATFDLCAHVWLD